MSPIPIRASLPAFAFLLAGCIFASGCRTAPASRERVMEVTAYCPCGKCNGYVRGRWLYLKLDQWNRYLTYGSAKGEKYTAKTAGGGRLKTPRQGLVSMDSLERPWMIPVRIALPWLAFPRKGTIAADTDYYPFGTEMYVPGWGWGVVDDRGGAIQGPERLDLLFATHWGTNRWGRQKIPVKIADLE